MHRGKEIGSRARTFRQPLIFEGDENSDAGDELMATF